MINKNHQLIYKDDEIDLYELWLTLKKHSKLIYIITLICILFIIVYIFMTPNIYKTNFVLQTKSEIVSPFQIKEDIKLITPLYILKEKLKLNNINKLKKLTVTIPRGEKNLVLVTLTVTDPHIINNIVNRLVSYLNSIPTIQKEIAIQKKQLIATIRVLEEQIKNLENLQQELNNNATFVNSLSIKIDPLQIVLSIQENKEKIIEAQAELKNLQAVKLAVAPITPKKPYWPRPKLLIAIAFIGGLFFSIFLAFFLEWIENAKKRFEEENKNN